MHIIIFYGHTIYYIFCFFFFVISLEMLASDVAKIVEKVLALHC